MDHRTIFTLDNLQKLERTFCLIITACKTFRTIWDL